MNREREVLRCAGLRFFGTISASVTHELKNTFAIVRELSGLLSDLGDAARGGRELAPDRVCDIADRIGAQVRRADDIVKRMNTFSHSVDRTRFTGDLRDVVTGILSLCRRFAEMRRVELAADLPDAPVTVETDPFVLQHAIFLRVRSALDGVGQGGRVTVGARADEKGARVRIVGVAAPPGDGEEELAGMLHRLLGVTDVVEGPEELELLVPARMPEREEVDHE